MSFQARIYYLGLVLCLYLIVSPGLAQDTSNRLIIAFVEDNTLNTVTRDETLGDSLSDLLASLDSFQIDPVIVDLRSPILNTVDLVVLIRPLRRLNAAQTAHLWRYMESGGNVLFAFDPNGYNNVNTEETRSGINQLLNDEYGISIDNNILIEPWFEVIPLFDITRSWSDGIADNVIPHIITKPHTMYGIPIRFWVGRSQQVETINGYARTNPLIYTENLHGETSRFNLDESIPGQFEVNIGEDAQGRLILASVSEHYTTGSRVAVIGDSEIFQNGFGQSTKQSDDGALNHLGSYVFAQRIMQWLLEIPEELWIPLPQDFTWIAVDGQLDDWESLNPATYDSEINEEIPPSIDITNVKLVHNDNFGYITIETVEPISESIVITLRFEQNENEDIVITLEDNSVFLQDNEIILDAEYTKSMYIESRLPLRIIGEAPTLNQVCLSDQESGNTDCYEDNMISLLINTLDPAPVRFIATPMAYVINTANLLSSPEGTLLAELPTDTQLAILGRDNLGSWVKVVNGRYEGWVEVSEVAINARRALLPVVSP